MLSICYVRNQQFVDRLASQHRLHSRELSLLVEVRKGFQGGTLVEDVILEHADLDVLEAL